MCEVSYIGGSSGNSQDDITNLLNHGSDFRRDNATRLWGYNGNSVNSDNFNRTGVVNS